tara:strand:- start:370 stop:1530 length:1161 start_codon:yes stop_codon:yes gene_type:complete
MDDLLKEAIADAKAVRETALANAKIALEEAFTPRLKSMLSRKIEAELSEEDDEMADDETSHDEVADDEIADDETSHDETSHDEVHDEEDKEPADDEMMKSEEEDSDEEPADDEVAYEGEDEDEPADDEVAYEGEEEDDDLDLEAVLAELESELKEEEEDEDKMDESEEIEESEEVTEEDAVEEGEEIEENDVSSDIGKSDNKQPGKAGDSSDIGNADKAKHTESIDEVDEVNEEKDEDEVDEDIDLEEVLKALSEEEDDEEKVDEIATLQNELKEHRDVVKYLREKLNEVNLLNAKLLFSNKLFRAFGLSNEQKLKVVETFDRTKNLREIKLVYSTLAESFQNRKPIKESKGSSSKAVASTKPQNDEVLTEGSELKNRFKKLANIL